MGRAQWLKEVEGALLKWGYGIVTTSGVTCSLLSITSEVLLLSWIPVGSSIDLENANRRSTHSCNSNKCLYFYLPHLSGCNEDLIIQNYNHAGANKKYTSQIVHNTSPNWVTPLSTDQHRSCLCKFQTVTVIISTNYHLISSQYAQISSRITISSSSILPEY